VPLIWLGVPAVAASANGIVSPQAQGHADGDSATTSLKHVVVMAQEGHTFDNYLSGRPGAAGRPSGVCVPAAGRSGTPCVHPYPINGSPHAMLRATSATQRTSVNGGRMDGFVRAQAVHDADGRVAMGYYPTKQLPILNGLADRGVLFDHWFAAVPGGSIANDLFGVAARSPGDVSAVPSGGWTHTPLIFDRLQAARVTWRVYVEDYDPRTTIRTATSTQQRAEGQVARVPLLSTKRWLGQPLHGHVVPLARYYQDLAHGRLPQVAFVVTTRHTERPPQNPATGQSLVRGVVNALLGSSAWAGSAFFLTYTDPGGWYDHVPPVAAPGGAARGLRVPTVMISPFARAGTVDHTVVDSAGILKVIEQNWSLPPLTDRDADAPSLLSTLTFHAASRTPSLVGVASTESPTHQPDRSVLYAGYLLALLCGVAGVPATLWWARPRTRQESP